MKYRFLLLFLALTLQNVLFAEISVQSFRKMDNDMTARIDAPKDDQNGFKCAVIKVVTNQKDFVWEPDALGIIDAVYKTGEYWLYIPYGAKRLTIKHPQLGLLRDYNYPIPIEKAMVYEMVLTTDEVMLTVKKREIESQWLLINSDPPGADVYINDQVSGKTPYQNELPVGKYTWNLKKQLYLPDGGVVELVAGGQKQKINVVLKPNFATLKINTTPENGAEVTLNGMSTGKFTPCTLEMVPTGSCTLGVSLDMYETTTQKLTLIDGETKDVSIPMNPTFSEVSITTEPSSDIFVNGEKKGFGSWHGRLTQGIYSFEARLDKYLSAEEKQSVIVGQPLTLTMKLTPRAGVLKVISNPMEANVKIDGKDVGQAPMTIKDILIGEHQVELSLSGYSTILEKPIINEGQTTTVNSTLVMGNPVTINSTTTKGLAVRSFRCLDDDLTARMEYPFKDQNGDLCAVIKVVTTQTGFSFDGGSIGIVSVEQKPTEIWVYVPYGAKRLTISHPKLGIIKDYSYPLRIDKASTYELILSTGE